MARPPQPRLRHCNDGHSASAADNSCQPVANLEPASLPETEQPADNVVAQLHFMRITIFDNRDGTFHVAISDKFGQSDSTCESWEAVLTILASLKPVELS